MGLWCPQLRRCANRTQQTSPGGVTHRPPSIPKMQRSKSGLGREVSSGLTGSSDPLPAARRRHADVAPSTRSKLRVGWRRYSFRRTDSSRRPAPSHERGGDCVSPLCPNCAQGLPFWPFWHVSPNAESITCRFHVVAKSSNPSSSARFKLFYFNGLKRVDAACVSAVSWFRKTNSAGRESVMGFLPRRPTADTRRPLSRKVQAKAASIRVD